MVECTAHYDPETVIYTVNVTLDISNQHPLVKEALLANVFLVEASRINMFLTDLGDSDFTSHSPQVQRQIIWLQCKSEILLYRRM